MKKNEQCKLQKYTEKFAEKISFSTGFRRVKIKQLPQFFIWPLKMNNKAKNIKLSTRNLQSNSLESFLVVEKV